MEQKGLQNRRQRLRQVGNWVNLTTPLGIGVARLGRARVSRGPRGLVLAERYRLGFPLASAFTIGNVLVTRHTWDTVRARSPRLFEHEERHTWQYLYCGGLPFFAVYVLSTGWSLLRTGDRAARNFFERQAGLEIGGYVNVPVRPISALFSRRGPSPDA